MFLRECEAYPEVGLGHFLITIDRNRWLHRAGHGRGKNTLMYYDKSKRHQCNELQKNSKVYIKI